MSKTPIMFLVIILCAASMQVHLLANLRAKQKPQQIIKQISPAEQAERNVIALEIARINEQFAAMGAALSSPARKSAIIQYLKRLGTPVAQKVYQEMVAAKEL